MGSRVTSSQAIDFVLGDKIVVDLPTLMETHLLIQANSGAGKSWAIRRIPGLNDQNISRRRRGNDRIWWEFRHVFV
jgi:hypothetical protein